MRKLFAALAVAALLAMPTGVFAANGLDQPVVESFTVNATYTLTGVPSNLTYPDSNALNPTRVWAPAIHIIAFGSSTPGAILSMSATDLSSGAHTIAATDRIIYTSNEVNCQTTPVHGSENSIGGSYGAAGSVKTLATLGASQHSGSLDLGLGLFPQDGIGYNAGVYGGTVTISVGA